MDILFCSDLSIKEEIFILGMYNIEDSGEVVTWDKIAKKIQVSSVTARKLGNKLAELGIIRVELRYNELGGAMPSELFLNREKVKEHIIKHQ